MKRALQASCSNVDRSLDHLEAGIELEEMLIREMGAKLSLHAYT
jgi:hypothetical protein